MFEEMPGYREAVGREAEAPLIADSGLAKAQPDSIEICLEVYQKARNVGKE